MSRYGEDTINEKGLAYAQKMGQRTFSTMASARWYIASVVALAQGTAQQVERGRAIACASLHHNGDPPYRA
jgi:hypothetical protein